MIRIISLLALLPLLPTTASAHRLDEYLQATRIAVAPGRVALELDLTPGVSLASEIVKSIDRDRNGELTRDEAYSYGHAVLAEIVLTLDGRALSLSLTNIRVPAIAAMEQGLGSIRIDAEAAVTYRSAGRHGLFYRNDHRPAASVYLVNALMPATRAVSIASQRRDVRQREFHLDYAVEPERAAIEWVIAATALLAGLAVSRSRWLAASRSAG
jgi:nickel/cobalt transporter (NicO) family protein